MMTRTVEQVARNAEGIARACLDFMRARSGERFLASQLAEALGLAPKAVTTAMNQRYSNLKSNVQRELAGRLNGYNYFRYWVGSADDQGDSATARTRIWLRRHKCAARPSVVAKALHMEVADVAKALQLLHATGNAVRCELPLRSGHDRYEYRLMGIAQ